MADCSTAKLSTKLYAKKHVICATWGCNNCEGIDKNISFFRFRTKIDQYVQTLDIQIASRNHRMCTAVRFLCGSFTIT